MRKTMKALIGIGVAASIGGTALAGASYADGDEGASDHDEQGMVMLAAIDADRDGTLTQAEIDKARNDRNAALAAHDANGDGNLDLEEHAHLWRETMRPATARAFQRLDTDGGAVISGSEYEQPLGGFVQRLDRNADASLSVHDASEHDHDDGDHDDDHEQARLKPGIGQIRTDLPDARCAG